ncbi:alpha/beta hydrolase [Parafrankia sp. BMG5.11]|nr:alpha/beta hydrolase [Parafrankia sp. BMG5.11]
MHHRRGVGTRPTTVLVVDLAVTEAGEGEALVVFVHGVLDSGRSFSRVVDLLASQCRMRWYDRRGYGTSTNGTGAPVDVNGHIEDLVAVLDGRRAVVVGHSFGGVIAAGAAVRAPESVAAVVLYETVMAWVPGWDDRRMRQMLWSEDPEDAGMRLMLGAKYDAMSAEARLRLRPQARAFVTEERSTRAPTPPYDIAALEIPVVYGFSESFPVVVMQQHLSAVVRDVELVTFPGDHFAHRTAPAEFAGLVRLAVRRASGKA